METIANPEASLSQTITKISVSDRVTTVTTNAKPTAVAFQAQMKNEGGSPWVAVQLLRAVLHEVGTANSWVLLQDGKYRPIAADVDLKTFVWLSEQGLSASSQISFVLNVCSDKLTCILSPDQIQAEFSVDMDLRLFKQSESGRRVVRQAQNLFYFDVGQSVNFDVAFNGTTTSASRTSTAQTTLKTAVKTTAKASIKSTVKTTAKTTAKTTKTSSKTKTTQRATTTSKPTYAEYCAPGKKYSNKLNCCCQPPIIKTRVVSPRGLEFEDGVVLRDDISVQHLCPKCTPRSSGVCCPANRLTITKTVTKKHNP